MVTCRLAPKKAPTPNEYGLVRRNPVYTAYCKNLIRLLVPDGKPVEPQTSPDYT